MLLAVYLLVALLNTSLVQSYVGAVVGNYFSKEWGGKVRIGSIHASPFSHVILDKIELISPTNDTIYYGDRISCRFKHFPFHKGGLKFDRVMLRNGQYHFESIRYPSGKMGINLDYIIQYFAPKEPQAPQPPAGPFVVEVGELRLRNIDYIMDLPEPEGTIEYEHGVSIPHMRFKDISGHFRKIRVDSDSITCRIVSLTTTEASGLHVVDLSADVEVSPHVIRATNLDLQTDDSRVFLDAEMLYHGWESMEDYCNNVRHEVTIKPGTEVNLRDASFWVPVLWGLDCKILVEGHAFGPVSNLTADNMQLAFGQNSSMLVNGNISGLPYIEHTTVDADVRNLHTNYSDLAAVQLPELARPYFTIPSIVERMSVMDINASAKGGLQDFEAQFDINSLIGDLECNAHVSYDSARQDYAYWGELDSRTLGVRSLLPNEWVSRTGLHFTFQGTSLNPETMDASLDGRLYNTNFRGRDLARTAISADISNRELNADIQLKDTLIDLDLSATADLVTKSYSADIVLDHAQITRLHLIDSDTAITLSTHLQASLHGSDIEEITGLLSIENIDCQLGSRRVKLDGASLRVDEQQGYKDLTFHSDWARLDMNGYFRYADMPLLVRDFCDRYMPTYYNPFREADSADLTPLYFDNFNLDIEWHDETDAIGQLVPGVSIADGSYFHGSYNYGEALKMVFYAPSLGINSVTFNDLGFSTSTLGENYRLLAQANNMMIGDNDFVVNLHANVGLGSDISTIALRWDDPVAGANEEGDLEFFLTSTDQDNRLMITKPNFMALRQLWKLSCPDGIRFNKDRLLVNSLKVYGLGQSATIKALISKSDDDYVNVDFKDFVLDDICSVILPGDALTVKGMLDGKIAVQGFSSTPYLEGNLSVENCVINGQEAGDVNITTNYRPKDKRLFADLVAEHRAHGHDHRPLEIHGDILLAGTSPQLNFTVGLDHVGLKTLGPALAQVTSNIDGNVSGEVRLSGTLVSPLLQGRLMVNEGELSLLPTGVTYYFNDDFTIENNRLTLDNFAVHDKLGNTVLANGDLTFSTEDILKLNLDVATNKVLVLDKEVNEGSDFYGTLLAKVNGTVEGSVNNLNIEASASTLDGSQLYVPIDNSKRVQENEFITFLAPDRNLRPRRVNTTNNTSTSMSNLDLRLNLHVTPGLKLSLPMDFDQLEANMNAVGRGDIQVTLHGNQPPDILGDYEFTSGNFSLSLVQLLTRNFTIEEGSTLNFPGNIDDARFNITAVYNLRANLASLMSSYASSTNDSYVQVQDIIKVSGTLQEPTIKFDIRLPNSEQSVSDQVFSYIDRNNELEMLNQSVSLLVLGQFTSDNASATTNSEGLNSLSLITNTAGSILTSLVKVVDVDFKYQASNSNLNPMGQFDVGISKSWNKFYFESTFGYGNVNSMDIDQSNTLMGDVKVGYRFNPYFNIYGFHRTNTSYYTRTELPYKQGLGVELSKDFDSLRELFSWFFKKPDTTTIK